jgi:flagellar hook-basal body complex protein FliE
MSDINVNTLLAQMQRLAALASGQTIQLEKLPQDFGALLKQAVEQVNQAQQGAQDLAYAFEAEQRIADLPETMIALQKARISFQVMVQARNKLVEAYQDIMNMPL